MNVIGHRGAKGLAPENTIASLKKALEHSVDGIEFDVRVTKDGVPILAHNIFLTDQSGNRRRIKSATYKELLQHKKDLASLDEAFEAIGRQHRLYIEVKFGTPVRPIIRVIKYQLKSGWPAGQIMLGSKSQKVLRELHAKLPDIPKIVIEPWSGLRATWRARELKTDLLSMNQLFLWSGFIRMISQRGYKLYTYTLNNPAKAKRWHKSGLTAVVTDYPDRFEK
jgi:glycerophosphoryl diester phosphodiesterase